MTSFGTRAERTPGSGAGRASLGPSFSSSGHARASGFCPDGVFADLTDLSIGESAALAAALHSGLAEYPILRRDVGYRRFLAAEGLDRIDTAAGTHQAGED
jgi:hypothetical protein